MFKNKFFLIGLFLSLIFPLIFFKVISYRFQDQVNLLYEMDKCVKDGQIPCRWIQDTKYKYGSPIFNYHSPLPYYFDEVIYLLTNNLDLSIKLMFGITSAGIYFFSYLFASKIWGNLKGSLVALFYLFLSSFGLIFKNNLVSNSYELMFFPLTLLTITTLTQKIGIQNSLLFVISSALILLSSSPPFIFIILIFGWIIYEYIKTKSNPFLIFSMTSLLFAFFLSSFYLLPAILERNLIHIEENEQVYLPQNTKEKPQNKALERYQILTGDSQIINFMEGTNWIKFETDTKTHTIIRLSQLYFPNWKILVDDKEAKMEYKNNSLGLMTIFLGSGYHNVYAKLYDTQIRTISNFISLISFTVFTLFLIGQSKIIKKAVKYYRKRIN